MFTSIRWRIIIPYTFLILLCVAGVGFYLSNGIYQTQLQTLQDRLTDDARLISDSLIFNLSDQTTWQAIDTHASHWAELIDARVTIIARDGTVLGESHQDATQMDNHLNRPEIQEPVKHGFVVLIRLPIVRRALLPRRDIPGRSGGRDFYFRPQFAFDLLEKCVSLLAEFPGLLCPGKQLDIRPDRWQELPGDQRVQFSGLNELA